MSLNRKTGAGLVVVFLLAVLTALLVQAAGTQAAGAEFTETMSLDAGSLRVNNLIGEIQVVPATGSNFEVEIRVQGKDATRERIKIETKRGTGRRGLGEVPAGGEHQVRLPEARARLAVFVHGQSHQVGRAR